MSLCVSSPSFFGSDADTTTQLFEETENSGDIGISLNSIVFAALDSYISSSVKPVVRVDLDLNSLEISSSCGKRKSGEDYADSSSKRCCVDRRQPQYTPSSISYTNFTCDMSLDLLVHRVESCLSSMDRCLYDYDSEIFSWNVVFMSSQGPLRCGVQIYKSDPDYMGPSDSELVYTVDFSYVSGEYTVFQMFFDRISDHVQDLAPLFCAFETDPAAIFSLYGCSPIKDEIIASASNLMKLSTNVQSCEEKQRLQNLIYLCSLLSTCRGVGAMKTVFDNCRVFYALIRCLESIVDEDFVKFSVSLSWTFSYTLRCLLGLVEVDEMYVKEMNGPVGRSFRSILKKISQRFEDCDDLLNGKNKELLFAEHYLDHLLEVLRKDSVLRKDCPSPYSRATTKLPSTPSSNLTRVPVATSWGVLNCFSDSGTPTRGISCSG